MRLNEEDYFGETAFEPRYFQASQGVNAGYVYKCIQFEEVPDHASSASTESVIYALECLIPGFYNYEYGTNASTLWGYIQDFGVTPPSHLTFGEMVSFQKSLGQWITETIGAYRELEADNLGMWDPNQSFQLEDQITNLAKFGKPQCTILLPQQFDSLVGLVLRDQLEPQFHNAFSKWIGNSDSITELGKMRSKNHLGDLLFEYANDRLGDWWMTSWQMEHLVLCLVPVEGDRNVSQTSKESDALEGARAARAVGATETSMALTVEGVLMGHIDNLVNSQQLLFVNQTNSISGQFEESIRAGNERYLTRLNNFLSESNFFDNLAGFLAKRELQLIVASHRSFVDE